jgi:hypothetical protein
MQPLILTATVPGYKRGQVPDDAVVGKKLDSLLQKHFLNRDVVVRCIGSQDHPSLSLDELTDIVVKTGTDKYDATRMGVGYEEFAQEGIQVDFYGEETIITKDMPVMPQQIWEMHHSAIGDRGFAVHVDLVLIYNRDHLNMVMELYNHHPLSDGYTFKHPSHKREALLGVIKVLG